MKLYLILFLFLSVSCSSQSSKNPSPCKELYEGAYYKTEKTFGVYKIKRTKNEQIEHVVKSKLKIKFALTWTEDCTCELRFSEVLENGIGHDFETMLKDVVRTEKIYDIKRDSTQKIISYKVKTTSNQHDSTDIEEYFVDTE
jgi:thiamine phosphate synthase YjbQ (UPF0047 family)